MAAEDGSVVTRYVPHELTEAYGSWAYDRVAAARTGGRGTRRDTLASSR
jgi:hypothetical protein